uniref:DNA replication factor Dna2 N-terminal domain-containing protein n=1 Tax=Phytophthora ramorum TaxID=164328 RepID=H3H5N9_PHYRM
MDSSRTPKRKRRRLESRRAGRKASTSSSSASRAESQIVWKDSPADKQIKVSGTGKMAVRREMQGFVGRLARASQQSPPSSSDEDKKSSRERSRLRREDKGDAATSRHLMFSPPGHVQQTLNTVRRRRSTETGESQDELFSVLDQMEQKYASPDVTGTLTAASRRPLPLAVAASTQDMSLMPTLAPSNSSTGTVSHRAQDAGRTQEVAEIQKLPKTLPVIKEQETAKTPQKSVVVEADTFDDLTDESWALVEQMESQRAPVEISQAQSLSQTELMSSQSFALTPRPMPSAACGESKKTPPVLPSAAPPSVVRPMHGVDVAQQLESPESFRRFLVLEVDRNVVNRSLLLRLLDDQDVQLEAMLIDDWDGFFSQDGHNGSVVRPSSPIQVDNTHNVVVVHPDILFCKKRSL